MTSTFSFERYALWAPLGWEDCTLPTEPSSIHDTDVSPLEGEKLSTGENPRNVSRFMLTEPRKYSSCNTENKPRNISSYFSNCF